MEFILYIILVILFVIIVNLHRRDESDRTRRRKTYNRTDWKETYDRTAQSEVFDSTTRREIEIEYIGRVGEETTEAIVNQVKECEYTLSNLYIPTANGGTAEIDLVAFTDRGLLVLETKNYSGTIYGNEDSDKWFASVYNQNNYFYNPLKQNAIHIKYLDIAVGLNIPIYSIIVFSDRCFIGYLPNSFYDIHICQMSTLRKTIKEIFDENPACTPQYKLSTAYSRIKKYANPSKETIRKHREYIRSKY